MANEFYRVLLSAPTQSEAASLMDTLVQKRLIAGGLITEGISRDWWKDEVNERTYYNLSAFTTGEKKAEVMARAESLSSDQTPIIAFFKIDEGSRKFLDWITTSTR